MNVLVSINVRIFNEHKYFPLKRVELLVSIKYQYRYRVKVPVPAILTSRTVDMTSLAEIMSKGEYQAACPHLYPVSLFAPLDCPGVAMCNHVSESPSRC